MTLSFRASSVDVGLQDMWGPKISSINASSEAIALAQRPLKMSPGKSPLGPRAPYMETLFANAGQISTSRSQLQPLNLNF